MLNKLSSVLRLCKDGDWDLIMGTMPSGADQAKLREMAQDRPSARKFAGGLAVTAPLASGGWHFWVLSEVPGVSELPAIMSRLQDLSKGIDTLEAAPVAPSDPVAASGDGTAAVLAKLAARVGTAGKIKPKALAPILLDTMIELGYADSGAILHWPNRGKPKVWLSDERLYGKSDEVRAICDAMREEKPRQLLVTADDPEEDAVEIAVLARNLGSKAAALVLPATGAGGYGLVAFGKSSLETATLAAVIDLMYLSFPAARAPASYMKTVRRAGLAAAFVGLGVFLAQPTPTILTTVGTTVATDVTSVALPSDAFLTRMHVRVGDQVAAGDIIGEFTSRTLDDALAEERLTASVEQLTAQAAMSENNFGTFQLANQRLEISQARIAQLEARRAELVVKAPVNGHVISAMAGNVAGLFGQAGQEVAQLQTSDAMRVRMELSRMDARLIQPGMTGTAYFRGLSQKSFDVDVISPPSLFVDPNSGQSLIESKASVSQPDGLIVGMTGFLRLEGPVAPRYVGYGRFISEYIREKSWIYLGLRL
jgi:multidrug efflux pump subunit AcrA (membrane-fusion protein)